MKYIIYNVIILVCSISLNFTDIFYIYVPYFGCVKLLFMYLNTLCLHFIYYTNSIDTLFS